MPELIIGTPNAEHWYAEPAVMILNLVVWDRSRFGARLFIGPFHRPRLCLARPRFFHFKPDTDFWLPGSAFLPG